MPAQPSPVQQQCSLHPSSPLSAGTTYTAVARQVAASVQTMPMVAAARLIMLRKAVHLNRLAQSWQDTERL